MNTFIYICFNCHNTPRSNELYFTMKSLLTLNHGKRKCPSLLYWVHKMHSEFPWRKRKKRRKKSQTNFLFFFSQKIPMRTCTSLSQDGRAHSDMRHSNCKALRTTRAAPARSLVCISTTLYNCIAAQRPNSSLSSLKSCSWWMQPWSSGRFASSSIKKSAL